MALGGIIGAVGGGTVGKAIVEVIGESSKLRSDLAKAKGDSAKATGAMGKDAQKFSAVSKAAFIAVGAAVVGFAASSVKAFMEAQKVTAQTEAVIKSTGGAANVTKEQVLDLASGLRDLSGVEDETIQAGANMLLTFTKIRNEVGAGNDIFNQSTAAVLDMSVAMGTDMSSAAILVGKALNNPIAGLGRLQRVGVEFTEQQKTMIRTLAESGDIMGAQKLILKELQVEFGGSAKAAGQTFAGQLNILKSQFGDIQESVGKFIITGLSPLVSGFVNLPGPIKTAAIAIVGLTTVLVAVGLVVKTVKGSMDALGLSFVTASGKAGAGGFGVALAGIIPVLGQVGLGIGALLLAGEGLQGLVNNLTNTISTEQALAQTTMALQQAVASGKFTWVEIQAAIDEYNRTIGDLPGAEKLTMDAIQGTGNAAGTAAGQVGELDAAQENTTSSAQELLAAELALAGGFVGVSASMDAAVDAEQTLAEARAELTKLTKEGKQGTEEYAAAQEAVDDAARGSLQSQLTLAGAVEKFVEEAAKTGDVRTAVALVREYGQKAGLTAGEVQTLITRVRGLIKDYKDVPESVATTVKLNNSAAIQRLRELQDKYRAIKNEIEGTITVGTRPAGGSGGGGGGGGGGGRGQNPLAGLQYGGIIAGASGFITRGPTMLVGESRKMTFAGRGTEAVIPFDQRGIGILSKALEKAGSGTVVQESGNYLAIHFNAPIYGMRDFKRQVELALTEASARFGMT